MTFNGKKIGFIGAGQMGRALMKGMIGSGLLKADQILVNDANPEVFQQAVDELGVVRAEDNRDLVAKCDVVFLAVKPQNAEEPLEEIKDCSADTLFISVVAGLTSQDIKAALDATARVIRTMPNTPALVSSGASALCKGANATDQDMELAQTLMGSVGVTVVVPEKHMDIITGLSGTGPAYVALFMEGLVEAGVRLGLDWAVTKKLVLNTVRGAAELAIASNKHLAELKNQVTSPGGTSAAGLHVMELNGFKAIIAEAVEAAANRSEELGRK